MRGEAVDALIKHSRAGPAGLRDREKGAVVKFVNNQVVVVRRPLPGEVRLVRDIDRAVGGKRDVHIRQIIADDIRRDSEMIHVGRHGIGDKNGPVAVGQLVHHTIEIAVSIGAASDLVEAVRVEMIKRGRAVRRVAGRDDIVIAKRNTWSPWCSFPSWERNSSQTGDSGSRPSPKSVRRGRPARQKNKGRKARQIKAQAAAGGRRRSRMKFSWWDDDW